VNVFSANDITLRSETTSLWYTPCGKFLATGLSWKVLQSTWPTHAFAHAASHYHMHVSVFQADWYSDKAELENAERAADESIELSVSNYSCSSAVSLRGFDGAYHHYRLVISARLNSAARRLAQYKLLLRGTTDNCDVRCQLKAAVDAILNQSRPIIDRLYYIECTSCYTQRSMIPQSSTPVRPTGLHTAQKT